jgi:hypothetical protein
MVLVLLFFILHISIKAESASIDAGIHYLRGDFGTDNSTTYISTPIHIKSQPFKYLITEISIPYIYQKRIDIITIGGRPSSGSKGRRFGLFSRDQKNSGQGTGHLFQNQQVKGQRLKNGPPADTPTDSGSQAETGPDNKTCIESLNENVHGIGDIYLYFSSDLYDLFTRFSHRIPTIDLSVGIKLPVADTEKGLGTGEYDYTFGLTLTWILGKAEYYLYGDYTWVGDMPQETFENISCFGCGAEIDLSSIYTLMADLSGCTSLFEDVSPHYSFEIGIKRKISKNYWIHGYGLAGYNEQSSDHGLGLSIGMDF